MNQNFRTPAGTFALRAVLVGLLLSGWLSGTSFAQKSDQDLEKLLGEAERALGTSGSKQTKPEASDADSSDSTPSSDAVPSKSKRSPTKHRKKDANVDVNGEPQIEKNATAPQETPQKLVPLTVPNIGEVLALDQQAAERERLRRKSLISAQIGAGMDQLHGAYTVSKDDDTFSLHSAQTLTGIQADVQSEWPITIGGLAAPTTAESLNQTPWRPSLLVGVGFGIFQGQVEIARRGVENYDDRNDYQLIPLHAMIGLGSAFYGHWLLSTTYGFAADVVRQLGRGQTDTYTELFTGDVFALGAGYRFDTGVDLVLRLQERGTPLMRVGSKESTASRVAGRVLTIGVGMPVAG